MSMRLGNIESRHLRADGKEANNKPAKGQSGTRDCLWAGNIGLWVRGSQDIFQLLSSIEPQTATTKCVSWSQEADLVLEA
jgi:hypothetical protein